MPKQLSKTVNIDILVVCTDLSDKELHSYVGVGVMVSTLAQNVIDVGSILALGTIFPVFITPMTRLL